MVPIVTRAQWGAAFTIPGGRHVAPSQRHWFVVHWPGSAVGGDERAVVRAIERSHRVNQGWQAAPGYNFLVGRSGTIYEGCGRDVRGIHSPPRNIDGWGVCVMIGVGENPPQAALNATRALYNWLSGVAGRTLGMSWHGQHWATACAGPALNAWVQRGMPADPLTPLAPPVEAQPNWRWCRKCAAMVATAPANAPCAAGGTHDTSASFNYVMLNNGEGTAASSPAPPAPPVSAQPNWRWCRKCGLMIATAPANAPCAAGGTHDSSSSFNYAMLNNGVIGS